MYNEPSPTLIGGANGHEKKSHRPIPSGFGLCVRDIPPARGPARRNRQSVLQALRHAVRRPALRPHQERALPAGHRGGDRAASRPRSRPSSTIPSRPPSRTPSPPSTTPGSCSPRWTAVFGALQGANTNKELQALARKTAPMLAAHRDDIGLNEKLFLRVKAVYDGRAALKLDREELFLLENAYRGFVRGGALLDAKQQGPVSRDQPGALPAEREIRRERPGRDQRLQARHRGPGRPGRASAPPSSPWPPKRPSRPGSTGNGSSPSRSPA